MKKDGVAVGSQRRCGRSRDRLPGDKSFLGGIQNRCRQNSEISSHHFRRCRTSADYQTRGI